MRKSEPVSTSTMVWAGAAVLLAAVVIWGAVQPTDPLSPYIHTDTARHILAFSAIGLCAALMPTAKPRILALGAVLGFAVLVEIIQIPVPDRQASWSDLFASSVGSFAGFGIGALVLNVFEIMREQFSTRAKASPRQP